MTPTITVTFDPCNVDEEFIVTHSSVADFLSDVELRQEELEEEHGEPQTWRYASFEDFPDSLLGFLDKVSNDTPDERELKHLVDFGYAIDQIQDDGYRHDAFVAYMEGENIDPEGAGSNFEEAYQGRHDNWKAFATSQADSLGYYDMMRQIGLSPQYFDEEAFGRDLQHDYVEYEDFYFRNV